MDVYDPVKSYYVIGTSGTPGIHGLNLRIDQEFLEEPDDWHSAPVLLSYYA